MNERTSNSAHDPMDDELDRAIRAVLSLPAPNEVRKQIIETAAAWRQKRLPWAAVCLIAALVLIVIGAGILLLASGNRGPKKQIATVQESTHPEGPAAATQPEPPKNEMPVRGMFAMWTTTVRVEMAENAPIIVANGGEKPDPTPPAN